MQEDTHPTYRDAIASDAKTLPPMARRVFIDTFAHLFEPTAFAAFCDTAYGEGGSMVEDLGDSRILWRIAEAAGEPVGYAKLRPWATPGPEAAPGALELQQIYVTAEWHGKGVARELRGGGEKSGVWCVWNNGQSRSEGYNRRGGPLEMDFIAVYRSLHAR